MLTSHAGALYPHARDSLGSAVVALLHFDPGAPATFYDDSIYHSTYVPTEDALHNLTTPSLSSRQSKFGGSALDLQKAAPPYTTVSGIIATPNPPQFILPSAAQPITVELWFWFGNGIASGNNFYLITLIGGGHNITIQGVPFGEVRFASFNGGGEPQAPFVLGWNYIAMQRHGTIPGYSCYLNGVNIGNNLNSDAWAIGDQLQFTIGGYREAAGNFTLNMIDEVRCTFAARFTPRAATIPVPTTRFLNP